MNRKADSIAQVINLDVSSCAQPSAHSLSHIPGIQAEPCPHTARRCWPPTHAAAKPHHQTNTLKMSKSFYYIAAAKEQQLTERNT